MKGSGLLIFFGLLALTLAGLGLVPWSKPGSFWRPVAPVLEEAAERHWTAEQIDRGRDFRSSGYGRYFLRKGLVGLLLVMSLALGWNTLLRRVPHSESIFGAVAALLILFVILDVLYIPFGLAGLKNARAFGISHQSTGLWFMDHLKGLAISLLITAVVALAFLSLMKQFPRAWPLPATLLAGGGGIVMALIVPLVIDPVFNTFTPLTDAGLRQRFLDIAAKAGVPSQEVLVSDASRRTTAVNAYFTGFGPTRRIVVYDTLIESLTPGEAELVLAHEAGHWSLGHITRGLLLGTLGIGLALFLGNLFVKGLFRNNVFDIQGPTDPAAMPLFLLLYWFGTFAALPIENGISRRMEAQADQFALDLTGDAETQVSVEVSLGKKNLADVIPPPLIRTLLYTHPTNLERIAQAESFAGTPSAKPPGEQR